MSNESTTKFRLKAVQAGFKFQGESVVGYKPTSGGFLKAVCSEEGINLSLVPNNRPGIFGEAVAFIDSSKVHIRNRDLVKQHRVVLRYLAKASMSGTEKKVLEGWLKLVPDFKTYNEAMNAFNVALKSAGVTKLSTVIINEMMDEIDLGRYKPDPKVLVALLGLIPNPQRDRMLTDDIIMKLIPSKDWPKFRKSDWIRKHDMTASNASAEIKLDYSKGNLISFSYFINLGDSVFKAYEDFKKDYISSATEFGDEAYFAEEYNEKEIQSDFYAELVKPDIKKAVEKWSMKIYNQMSTDEVEYHLVFKDVEFQGSPESLSATVECELQVQIQPINLLDKIEGHFPKNTLG